MDPMGLGEVPWNAERLVGHPKPDMFARAMAERGMMMPPLVESGLPPVPVGVSAPPPGALPVPSAPPTRWGTIPPGWGSRALMGLGAGLGGFVGGYAGDVVAGDLGIGEGVERDLFRAASAGFGALPFGPQAAGIALAGGLGAAAGGAIDRWGEGQMNPRVQDLLNRDRPLGEAIPFSLAGLGRMGRFGIETGNIEPLLDVIKAGFRAANRGEAMANQATPGIGGNEWARTVSDMTDQLVAAGYSKPQVMMLYDRAVGLSRGLSQGDRAAYTQEGRAAFRPISTLPPPPPVSAWVK